MNKFLLIGNLTKDIELKTTNSGKEVCTLSVAINNGKDDTTFIDVAAFGATAVNCEKYLSKGSKIAAECMIKNNNYEKDGRKVYGYQFLANSVEFLSPKAEAAPAPVVPDVSFSTAGASDFSLADTADELPF